ncbi:MAG: lysophospholipid acyltransferase family protein [Planctomycetes bacterium]|nr:lysophospholipid acyltransferase family protein [Planctomycetota bacterium]
MPRRVALALARLLGRTGYYLVRGRRRVMLENLRIAFPDMADRDRKRTAMACSIAFAVGVIENFRIGDLAAAPERFFEFEESDITRLRDIFKRGNGVVFVYFHYGNWELLPPAYHHLELPRASAVARHIKNPLITDMLTRTRTQDNLRILFRGHAGKEIVRSVMHGEGVGIPCDINTTRDEGIFVDFFGKPAATTPAPARISLRYGAPIVITFIERKKEGDKYLVRFTPVLEPDGYRNREDAAAAMMGAVNLEIENVIRRDPTQYLWGHRRWNTRPPGDDWRPRY